jgi:hypothetical protein
MVPFSSVNLSSNATKTAQIFDLKTSSVLQKQILRKQIRLGALRWLHGLDLDPTSKTYGVADREYWAWKTKDFANGTWQGGLAGFLDAMPFLDDPFTPQQVQAIVRATIAGARSIQRKNGSFEEAYPLESSMCVTALVLFNLLYAEASYPNMFDLDTLEHLTHIVKGSLDFLENTPETHGIISNHLATNVMAQSFAKNFLGDTIPNKPITDFLALQDVAEGWFPEYGGADPGYQTLLNYYLIAGNRLLQRTDIALALQKSNAFLQSFCFPDGSFAGEVGHRGTGIVYPGGTLIQSLPELAFEPTAFTSWWLQHKSTPNMLKPTAVEAGNFVPLFNSWALLGRFLLDTTSSAKSPFWQYTADGTQHFPNAGLIVVKTEQAMMVFSKQNAALRKVTRSPLEQTPEKTSGSTPSLWQDESIVALTSREEGTDRSFTTQGNPPLSVECSDTQLRWQYQSKTRHQMLNTLATSITLRLLGLVCMVSPVLQRILKKMLANAVMKNKDKATPIDVFASVDLSDSRLQVTLSGADLELWECQRFGFHQHMASANTFQSRALPQATGQNSPSESADDEPLS